MSGIRRIFMLVLCLCVLAGAFPSAVQAADERKTTPTVKMVSAESIRPGAEREVTISCNKPGFLTATVLDSEKSVVATICEEKEVPGGKSLIAWDGILDDGTQAEKGGKYTLSMHMRDEWGNEIKKDATGNLKIGEPRPSLSDVTLKIDSKQNWVIEGTASMPGYVVVDLYSAGDLENRYMNIISGYEKTNKDVRIEENDQPFSYSWNGKIAETEEKKTSYYNLDSGYYTVCVYLDDKENIRSELVYFDVSVADDKNATAYITGEEPSGFTVDAGGSKETQTAQAPASEEDKDVQTDEEEMDDENGEDDEDNEEASASNETKEKTAENFGTVNVGGEELQIGVGVTDRATAQAKTFWNIDASASDEDIWAALQAPMYSVDGDERTSMSILKTPESDGAKLGQINVLTQAVNVIGEKNEWSIIEAYRNEDGAYTRGYIRTARLRSLVPDSEYGITIDKATQMLTVWKRGERVGSVAVSTGLATSANPERETPAGEFILATRMGTKEMYFGYSKYSTRISGDVWLQEIPSTKKDGTDFSEMEDVLGEKMTRGTIVVAHESSDDGAINMKWIWDNLKNKRIKVLIFEG